MQQGKTSIVSILMVLIITSLLGCTTTYLDMQSWEGRTVEDLYWDWGKPDKVEDINQYERVYTYYIESSDKGKAKTCTKRFYARSDGSSEVIYNTSYSDCLFLIAK